MTTQPIVPFVPDRVLAPLDGSPVSAAVLPYVAGLAADLKASVTLLQAVASLSARPDAERYLESRGAPFRERGVTVATVAAAGDPSLAIVHEAGKSQRSIIAMTGHARPGGRRDLIGSVAHRVLQNCTRPVLVLRTADTAWRRPPAIVLGLDGSLLARVAIPVALGLAQAFAVPLVLVRATPPPAVLSGAARYYGSPDQPASQYLAEVAAELAPSRVSVEHATGTRPADRMLIEAADSRPGSIIVLSTRGMTGAPGVLGSTADRVVRSQTHPVLAVPARS